MNNSMENNPIPRREALLKLLRLGGLSTGAVALGVWFRGRSQRPEEPVIASMKRGAVIAADPKLPELAVIQGEDPRQLVRRAVDELGGIRRFISRNDIVLIKPNIGWDRTPEQGANTNPLAVAELARMCLEASAAKVVVTDVSCNEARRCFQRSGIAAAARAEGAEVILPDEQKFREVDLRGEVLTSWQVFHPFLEADKVINIPIAKHHSLTGTTLGMKNWYGILGGPRHRLHQRIHESLADLADFMRPTLTIIDAYRVLLRNGPTGGSLQDVELKKTVLAGTDPVALDAYAAKAYWNLGPKELPYLKLASGRGLGTTDFERLRIRTVHL
ncbi:MAG: DUF362 domain-containing protein [Terriglobales bacterium]